ncbi:MAG: PAS domain-containing protein, partial [Dongiaceae bacterium]
CSDAVYDAPFRRLKKLLGVEQQPGAGSTHPFESAELNEIYGYWLAKKGQRRMASRRDLDPTEIPRLLRNMMLIDVSRDPFRFGYRLIGTNVVDATGENRTGKDFDVVGFFSANPTIKQEYVTVATTGEPLHSFEPFYRLDTRREYDVERLLLPLSSDGVTVDMILVYFHFKTGAYSAH